MHGARSPDPLGSAASIHIKPKTLITLTPPVINEHSTARKDEMTPLVHLIPRIQTSMRLSPIFNVYNSRQLMPVDREITSHQPAPLHCCIALTRELGNTVVMSPFKDFQSTCACNASRKYFLATRRSCIDK